MSFGQLLQSWHDVYLTAGAAAATLAGLLFVGLSLHIRMVVTHPDVRSLARVTLSDFFVVLVISLFALAPGQTSLNFGYELGVIAVVSTALMVRPAVDGLRSRRSRRSWLRVLVVRFGLSGLANLGIAALAIALIEEAGGAGYLQLLLVIVVVLLMVAVRNTWDLLVTVADKS